ncbi:MAG: hypothetical protein ACTHNT_06895 [Actinomycetales bacterium]
MVALAVIARPETSVPALLIVALAAVLAIAGLVWLLGRNRRGPLDEVERWSHAREVTTRWSRDPDSSPRPATPIGDVSQRGSDAEA